MAQATSNPKIEELRFRLKTDPKSRLFFPLAEELRKISQFAEAEQVLRTGLTNHPTYLSAWVSLGRVSRDLSKFQDAVEALNKALTLDPGNVVAARLLGDAYLGLGQHIEAIKKYKLVRALVPGDEDLDTVIEKLEVSIRGGGPPPPPPPPPPATEMATPATPVAMEPPLTAAEPPSANMPAAFETPAAAPPMVEPQVEPPPASAVPSVWQDIPATPAAAPEEHSSPFEVPAAADQREEIATGDVEPMLVAHAESPFEEPVAGLGYSADAFELEQPAGMHIEPAPLAAEMPAPVVEEPTYSGASARDEPAVMSSEPEADDVFAPSEEPSFPSYVPPAPPDADDFAKTITMADLYAQQGLIDEARDIYEDILMRDPSNDAIRAKLEALSDQPPRQLEEPPLEESSEAPFEASAPAPFESERRAEDIAPVPAGPSQSETPFEAHSETPFEASETPFEISHESPFESSHETPFGSSHETPFETPDSPVAEVPPLEAAAEPHQTMPESETPLDLPVEPPPAMAHHSAGRNTKVGKLQSWLSKVSR